MTAIAPEPSAASDERRSRGPVPCFVPGERTAVPGAGRVSVVQILATGGNGGAQESLFGLVTGLDRSRYDVCVVSLSNGSSVRRLQRAGISTMVIEEPDDAIAVGALAAHLARIQPDVIHNHMYRAEVVGTKAALALDAAGYPRPYVVSTVHSSRVRPPEDREELRRLTPSMDRLIAVSDAIVDKIQDEGREGAEVSLIYNGVDLERYDHQEPCCTLREEYGMEPGAQIVGIVARLEPEKGHATLLDAWPLVLRSCPDAYLLVVGEGSRCDALMAQAADLGIARRVVFTGRREDVPAVTAALDVAVLPSYREAQGLSVLEAMALSRPVVASNVGGIPEMIEDGVTGLLVPPRDPEALAAAIVRLLSDHSLADMLGRAGHDLVHRRFCIEQMVSAIEDIYDEGARAGRLAEIAAG
jgi:glycosyltransferase involved in cell wall biosynthesis